MDVGHAKGKTITPETALSGVGVPLHPGAEKFYKNFCILCISFNVSFSFLCIRLWNN